MMGNTVPLKKQSKRVQKEYHDRKRGSWYGISPVTRVVPSGRIYDRKRMEREDRRTSGECTLWHISIKNNEQEIHIYLDLTQIFAVSWL